MSHLLLSAAEARVEFAKNIDIHRAGYIISLWSSFETQNRTLETIWNKEDIKKKKKVKVTE